VSFLFALPQRYRLILCDLWGVVHDGFSLYPGVVERLRQWRAEQRFVVLITNAPRPTDAIEQHLSRLALPRDAWDALVTGGESGIAAIKRLDRPVGFVGTAADRAILEGKGVRISDGDGFSDLACTGLEERRPQVRDYAGDLQRWAARGVPLHCLNPDRVVIQGGAAMVCAGAIADAYEALGGRVTWYGKPYPPIYRHALDLAGNPPPDHVLAVGDGLQTDILGAARMGFDAVYVTGGIGGGKGFPDDFAVRNGLGAWQPVAVVDSLG
jgi:HAD superfamily hydrolase (TIGR01459 family)